MERREMLAALGAVAMAGLAVQANAAQEAEHQHEHHHDHAGGRGKFDGLLASSSDCLGKGESCLAHCLVLLADGDKVMASCAQSVNQLLAFCTALQKAAAQQSPYTARLAKVVLDVCVDCEKECRKHEKKHVQCKACADACAECIKECKAIGV
uniref:Ferredoxin n=1 Tax=uncultured prokaryote AT3 TaxID=672202 RepID=D3W8F4_9ZZZZ|nr:hypothetical protein [uncultured prokaryote AT3]